MSHCSLLVVALIWAACACSQKAPTLGPEEVVAKFYRWYIGYPANPLADGEYRNSPYLASELIGEVDRAVASFDLGGYDPFLLAQDIPERFTVREATTADDRASVTIGLYWGGNPDPSLRQVDLELVGGEWKIVRISAIGP